MDVGNFMIYIVVLLAYWWGSYSSRFKVFHICIVQACVSLSKSIGEERTELELLPQCWEQVNSRNYTLICPCQKYSGNHQWLILIIWWMPDVLDCLYIY
jgi:hypothetical protein